MERGQGNRTPLDWYTIPTYNPVRQPLEQSLIEVYRTGYPNLVARPTQVCILHSIIDLSIPLFPQFLRTHNPYIESCRMDRQLRYHPYQPKHQNQFYHCHSLYI